MRRTLILAGAPCVARYLALAPKTGNSAHIWKGNEMRKFERKGDFASRFEGKERRDNRKAARNAKRAFAFMAAI